MSDTKPSERAAAAAKAVAEEICQHMETMSHGYQGSTDYVNEGSTDYVNEVTFAEAAAAIIDEHFRLPELTGEMSSRAIQAGLDIAQLGHETENIVQWGDAGRIIDRHFPGHDELLAVAKELLADYEHLASWVESTVSSADVGVLARRRLIKHARAALAAAKEVAT
jgi:hypothetical protein